MPDERPDPQLAVGLLDPVESADVVDVDQMARIREAELHHRDQALPAGEDFRLVAVCRE